MGWACLLVCLRVSGRTPRQIRGFRLQQGEVLLGLAMQVWELELSPVGFHLVEVLEVVLDMLAWAVVVAKVGLRHCVCSLRLENKVELRFVEMR